MTTMLIMVMTMKIDKNDDDDDYIVMIHVIHSDASP
jgi:hypothetical protein